MHSGRYVDVNPSIIDGWQYRGLLLGLIWLMVPPVVMAQESQTLLYSQKEFRYQYYQVLLRQVLDVTETEFGKIELKAYDAGNSEITEARGMALLHQKRIQITFVPTNEKREKSFRAVSFPLDQGLLGLRLLLIKAENQQRFDLLRNETEFREKMQGGFNTNWSDYDTYLHNGFKVVPATKYETLFKMLESGRFDYFSRGLIEIWSELDNFKNQYSDLRIENRFAFYYDIPVYFFVHKDDELLAQRLELGLKRLEATGAFSRLFLSYYGEKIDRAKLDQRQIITLVSPQSQTKIPHTRPFWWPNNLPFKATQNPSNSQL